MQKDKGVAMPTDGGVELCKLSKRALGVVTERYGGLGTRCRCSNMEVWSDRGIEAWKFSRLWKRAVSVVTEVFCDDSSKAAMRKMLGD